MEPNAIAFYLFSEEIGGIILDKFGNFTPTILGIMKKNSQILLLF
jgi:hypothetical protein